MRRPAATPPPALGEGADRALVEEALRRLVPACRPERVWLFGSRARGDATPDSDLDLMVVVPDERSRDAWWAGVGALRHVRGPVHVEAHVWGHGAFHDRLHLRGSLPSAVVREGTIVYEEESLSIVDARGWLDKADEDLAFVQAGLAMSPPRPGYATVHLQQAVEKAGKGLMSLHDLPFRPVRSLEELADRLAAVEPEIVASIGALFWLTTRAGDLRSPMTPPVPDPEVARVEGWLLQVAEVVEEARARVEGRAAES